MFGYKYNYETDTDDEDKYITKNNKKFKRWKRSKREAHILRLWRTLYNQALGCAVLITQIHAISTKV